jgi:hypothetical protein
MNSLFEHEIIYTTFEGHVRTKRFSDYVNIAIKTEQVASSYVVVYIRGTAVNQPLVLTAEMKQQLGMTNKEAEVEILNQVSQYVRIDFELNKSVKKRFVENLGDWVKILIVAVSVILSIFLLHKFMFYSRKIDKKEFKRKSLQKKDSKSLEPIHRQMTF